VWADDSLTGKYEVSPYWAYRRWPAQVVGVVTVEPSPTHPAPYVVTRWSDGTVTGVDAQHGRVVWQQRIAPVEQHGYVGRRTGARTVYDPRGLYTATGPDGTPVLVVAAGDRAAGYDPASGRLLWTRSDRCAGKAGQPRHPPRAGWTGETTYVARCGDRLDILDATTGQPLGTWTGRSPRPWGCPLGQSGCRMITTADGTNARLARGGTVVPAPAARSTSDLVVDSGYVEWRTDSYVGVVGPDTGAYRWQRPLRGAVISADPTRIYLLTPAFRLVTLDAATGAELSHVSVRGARMWRPGYVYVHDGFVVLERVIGRPQSDDDAYYYTTQASVVLAGTNPEEQPQRRPGTGHSLPVSLR
jgi:glucose dehydrogenase